MMFDNIQLTPELLPILTAAILQFIKSFPPLAQYITGHEKEWLPILSMAVGVGLAYAIGVVSPILPGIMIGLAASGGYDLLKGKTPK
jgi:uncharacterized membrane protein